MIRGISTMNEKVGRASESLFLTDLWPLTSNESSLITASATNMITEEIL